MSQKINHWIALYLSGKYPGHFRTPDKLYFIDKLQAINPTVFSDEKIKMFGMFGQVDEYEFYLSFLNKVDRDFPENSTLFKNSFDLPSEITNIQSDEFPYVELLNEFSIVKQETNPQKKGKGFEEFLKKFFNQINGLEVMDTKQASDEQIDLIIKNNINRPFWISLGSSLFIGEAKHTTSLTKTEAIKKVIGTLDFHKNISKIGIFISMEGFTKEKDEVLKRVGGGDKIISCISGLEIEEFLTIKTDPLDWLEDKIIQSFK